MYDALTYAGNRASLDGVPHEFVARRHRRPRRSPRQTLRDYEIDVVVNFAAESHNSYAITNPGVFFRTNVVGTQTLCEAVRRVGVERFHRFHHVSTCEVYGDLDLDATEPFTESSPYAPRTPYNASKAGGDHAVRAYHETFGPADLDHELREQLRAVPVPGEGDPALRDARADRRPRHPVVRVDAEPAGMDPRRRPLPRDRDASSTTAASARRITSVPARNAASRRSPTACSPRWASPTSLKTIVPDRPGHDRRYLLDRVEDHRELGWEPTFEFEAGLDETVQWYAENRDWWEPLLGRAPVDEATSWK